MIYKLKFALYNKFQVLINDMLVFSADEDGLITLELPINQFLLKGPNQLSIQITSKYDDKKIDNAFVSIVKSSVDNYTKESKVTEIKIDEFEFKDLNTNFASSFIVNDLSSYSTLSEYQKVDYNPEIVSKAEKILEQLFLAFLNKDVNKILSLCKIRYKNLTLSYYRNETEYMKNMNLALINLVNDSTKELIDIKKQIISPKLYGYGKFIRFFNKDEESPICLFNANEMTCDYFEVFIGFNKNLEAEIVL